MRRANLRFRELFPRVGERGADDFELKLRRLERRDGIEIILLRREIVFVKPFYAEHVPLGLLDVELALTLRALGGVDFRLIRARIDFEQQVARLDVVAVFHVDADDASVDFRLDFGGGLRLDEAAHDDVFLNRALLRARRGNGGQIRRRAVPAEHLLAARSRERKRGEQAQRRRVKNDFADVHRLKNSVFVPGEK